MEKNYGTVGATGDTNHLVNGGSRALSADIASRVVSKDITPPGSSAGYIGQERSFVSRYFQLEERGTTVAKEIRAGTATFLTMAYILLVNPEILGTLQAIYRRYNDDIYRRMLTVFLLYVADLL